MLEFLLSERPVQVVVHVVVHELLPEQLRLAARRRVKGISQIFIPTMSILTTATTSFITLILHLLCHFINI